MTLKKQLDPETALSRAAGLCARSEQCEWDIRKKLVQWNVEPSEHASIIEFLYSHRFLDATRYAGAYCRHKLHINHWGPIKIRMMLRLKRMDEDVIDTALTSIPASDYDAVLSGLVASASRQLDLTDTSDRNKLIRRLMSRGFSAAEVINAIKSDNP